MATFSRLGGYGKSALAWWDCSADKRPKSSSTVLAPSLTMHRRNARTGEGDFPWVFSRLPQELVMHPISERAFGPPTGQRARNKTAVELKDVLTADEVERREASAGAGRDEAFDAKRRKSRTRLSTMTASFSGGGKIGCGKSAKFSSQPTRSATAPCTGIKGMRGESGLIPTPFNSSCYRSPGFKQKLDRNVGAATRLPCLSAIGSAPRRIWRWP